jgi:hypothetical protein
MSSMNAGNTLPSAKKPERDSDDQSVIRHRSENTLIIALIHHQGNARPHSRHVYRLRSTSPARTDVTAYAAIEVANFTPKGSRKIFVVVQNHTGPAEETAKQKAQGSLLRWNELNIAM